MKKILTYKGAVMTWECDSNRHMNVMYYVNKFENAGRYLVLEMGIFELMNTDDNVGFVVLEQNIKYFEEVFEDDLLYIESHLVSFSNKAFTMRHEMHKSIDKKLVSAMDVVGVMFDKVNRKALPIPENKKKHLEAML